MANANIEVVKGVNELINLGFLSVVVDLIDVFNERVNPNNILAVTQLLTTGNYEKSSNPIESLSKILKSRNNYEEFNIVYTDSASDAVLGAKELDKEFPGIDIKGDTLVKTRKHKTKTEQNS